MGACVSAQDGSGGICAAPERHKVLIVGGGFAGVSLAKCIEKDQAKKKSGSDAKQTLLDVTLVSPQDYFDINYHTFRGLVETDKIHQQIIPLGELLPKTHIVHGKCTEVMTNAVTISPTDEGQRFDIPFDVLILCTGCRYTHGSVDYIKGGAQAATAVERVTQIRDKAAKLQEAETFSIIGGGPSAIEMAAELLTHFPEKKVVLISRGKILKDLNEDARTRVAKFFIVHKDHVQVFEETKRAVNVKQIGAEPNQFVFTGVVPNTEFLRRSGIVQLDKEGYVQVQEGTYQIMPHENAGIDNVFCFGDIARPNIMTGGWKSGEKTMKLARHIYENVRSYLDHPEKPLSVKVAEPSGAVISLGPQDGVGCYGDFNMPTPAVVQNKSKDMGVGNTRKLLGLPKKTKTNMDEMSGKKSAAPKLSGTSTALTSTVLTKI